MTDIEYRKAVPSDIPAIEELFAEMLKSVGDYDETAGYESGYLDRFFTGSGNVIYAAEAEGRVIGYISVELHDSFIYLDDLSVSERYRSCGIGSKLIALAEKHGGEMSALSAVLHVEKSNDGALRLYKRLGYTTVADEESRFRMEKQLQR